MFQNLFEATLSDLGWTRGEAGEAWSEVQAAYTDPQRHYHTIDHLENVWENLAPFAAAPADRAAFVLALAYHDIVYNPLAADNEERSADLFRERVGNRLPPDLVATVVSMILATRGHAESADPNTNFFTDADLAILGAGPDIYEVYAKSIRLEYASVPEEFYAPGRIRVLEHFLRMPAIFKTIPFRERFEEAARRNLQEEKKKWESA